MRVNIQDIRDNWKNINSKAIQDAIIVERHSYNSIQYRLPDNELQESINHIQNFCNGDLYETLFTEYYGNIFEPIGEKGVWTDEFRPTRGEPDLIHKESQLKVEFKCYNMSVESFVEEGVKEHWWDLNSSKFHNARHILYCSRPEGYKLYHFYYDDVDHKWYYELSKLSTDNFMSYMNNEVFKRKLGYWCVQ